MGDRMKKITAVALTYGRPHLLGRTIASFLRQTHPNCELVVLCDGGQYPDQPSGDRWRVVSITERCQNLGTKRNVAARLVSEDTEQIAIFDDDDIQLPWHLEACAKGLESRPWVQARQALEWDGKELTRHETYHRDYPDKFAFHGNWAYSLEEFWAVDGYPPIMDDDRIAERMTKAYGPSADSISVEYPLPAYIYSREPTGHLSWLYAAKGMDGAWDSLGKTLQPAKIEIGWDRDYAAMEIPKFAKPRAW